MESMLPMEIGPAPVEAPCSLWTGVLIVLGWHIAEILGFGLLGLGFLTLLSKL